MAGFVGLIGDGLFLAATPVSPQTALGSLRIVLDGQSVRDFVASRLRTTDGRYAVAVLLKAPSGQTSRRLELLEAEGRSLWSGGLPVVACDAAVLSEAFSPDARTQLVRLGVGAALPRLRLAGHEAFARLVFELADGLAPPADRSSRWFALTERLTHLETVAPRAGSRDGLVSVIACDHAHRAPFRLVRSRIGEDGRAFALVEHRPLADRGHRVLMVQAGDAVWFRRLDATGREPLSAFASAVSTMGAPAFSERRRYWLPALKPYFPGAPALATVFRCLGAARGARAAVSATMEPLFRISIETAVPTRDGRLFVAGWLDDPSGLVERIEAFSPYGEVRLEPVGFHRLRPHGLHQRLQKTEPGVSEAVVRFVATYAGAPDPLGTFPCELDIVLASGERRRVTAPAADLDPAESRRAILAAIPTGALGAEEFARSIRPVVAAAHAACLEGERVRASHAFGTRRAAPRTTVVVPLYKALHFIASQLAAFSYDRDVRDAELVYVLDSPEQEEQAKAILGGRNRLYDLDVTLLVHARNLGFAPAVNSGAAVARGRDLLLLNADVIPERPGWLAMMRRARKAAPRTGIIGPALLFHDGSLQHAGMFFDRTSVGRWINRHYGKGWPAAWLEQGTPREVPAVTGACMLIATRLYRAVHGLAEDYVVGDFEDSDLCLKVREKGYRVLLEPRARLYHFERSSIEQNGSYTDGFAAEHNGRLHEMRWAAAMAALMGEARFAPAAFGA